MNKSTISCLLCIAAFCVGCKQAQVELPKEKPPRPVEVSTLQLQAPTDRRIVTASAASWKSEQISFEVSGRVEWVVEPNTNVEGRIVNGNNEVIIQGEPIARVESEKYRLQKQQAESELARAKQSVAAAKTELEKSFPAQFQAAEADLELARIDRERRIRLVQRNAGAQADADKAEASYQNALSKIEQLKSAQKAKESEFESINLQVEIARQSLQEAKRNLDNCVLYSSFRGQIADVLVVPGSFVAAGNPIATVQMMNPIKAEFEVSAEDSRRLRNRQNVPVFLTGEDGKKKQVDGYLYLIESIADPQTRTFTVTVLVKNQNTDPDSEPTTDSIPTADQVWPMTYDFLPGTSDGVNFLAEEIILEDDQGSFVWKIDNLKIGEKIADDRLLSVSKLRVEKQPLQLPFLGSWLFRQVKILDESIDLQRTLVAGKLSLPVEQAGQWVGEQVRLESTRQWETRPGDLVQVDLSENESSDGLFVPVDSIIHHADRTYLALVSGDGETATVTRREIKVVSDEKRDSTSSIWQVAAADGQSLVGKRYVTKGAHFLIDGQQVRVLNSSAGSSKAGKPESAK